MNASNSVLSLAKRSRSRNSRISGRLWKRQPVDSGTSSTPRPSQSRTSSSSSARSVSGPISSAKSVRMSRSGIGCCAQMSAVSRTRFASCVFMKLRSLSAGGAGMWVRGSRNQPRRSPGPVSHGEAGNRGSAGWWSNGSSRLSRGTLWSRPRGAARFACGLDRLDRQPAHREGQSHCSEASEIHTPVSICDHANAKSAGGDACSENLELFHLRGASA